MIISVDKISKKLIIFLFYYTLFIQGLMALLKLPQGVLYLKDAIIILIIVITIISKYKVAKLKLKLSASYGIMFVFLSVCLISAFIANVELINIGIALRKVFRGFIYFYFCILYLEKKDIDTIIHNSYWIQIFNMFLICIQRFVLGYNQDLSNGIFGTDYTNNYLSVFCMLLVFYFSIEYLLKKCSLSKLLIHIAINGVIIIVAELKVLFFVLPLGILIIFWNLIIESKRGRKLFIYGIIGVLLMLVYFNKYYSNQMQYLTSIKGLLNYNNWGLATHAEVTRLNWITYTTSNIFKNHWIQVILGVGFGTVSGLAHTNGMIIDLQKLGYGSYSLSTVFMETGILGILLLISWFVCEYRSLLGNEYLNMDIYIRYGKAMIIICLIFLVYANFLFNDSCFIVFFSLAIPRIIKKDISFKANNG